MISSGKLRCYPLPLHALADNVRWLPAVTSMLIKTSSHGVERHKENSEVIHTINRPENQAFFEVHDGAFMFC